MALSCAPPSGSVVTGGSVSFTLNAEKQHGLIPHPRDRRLAAANRSRIACPLRASLRRGSADASQALAPQTPGVAVVWPLLGPPLLPPPPPPPPTSPRFRRSSWLRAMFAPRGRAAPP